MRPSGWYCSHWGRRRELTVEVASKKPFGRLNTRCNETRGGGGSDPRFKKQRAGAAGADIWGSNLREEMVKYGIRACVSSASGA